MRGVELHWVEWGDRTAAPVVLLHGITGHARTWDAEARALAARWRVLALDQRGHGDSGPAPGGDYSNAALAGDLGALVETLGLARPRLVGLSMGGRVAIQYAGTHPGTVARLVVVDIGPAIAPAGMSRVGQAMAGAPERFASIDEVVASMRAGNPRYREDLLHHRAAHAVRPLPGGGYGWKYDRALREAARQGQPRPVADLWPLWKSIACPTLLVRGAESDILSPEVAARMVETQPRARLAVVPGAGHTVPGDQPEAFLGLLTGFLDEG